MTKKIALLATDGFEEIELTSPKKNLEKKGFEVLIISDKPGKIKAWDNGAWSSEYSVDKSIDEVSEQQFHALVLPGGVINPDKLRLNDDVLNFVRKFFDAEKPVAAICHGPWTLINAEVVKRRKMTSFKSLKKDLINAGAIWIDKEVVVDGRLITSRNPDDLPAFNAKLIEEIEKD